MSNIFFTSDQHWGHKNVIKYCDRPFKKDCQECGGSGHIIPNDIVRGGEPEVCSVCHGDGFIPLVDEMDKFMIEQWNSVVKPGDVVYHIGDIGFFNNDQDKKKALENVLKRLNGSIHLIFGNHDSYIKNAEGFAWKGDYKTIKSKSKDPIQYYIVMCHYPMLSWNRSHYGSVMIHGHCHGSLQKDETQIRIDVGVDCWDFKPVPLSEILRIRDERMENNQKKFGKPCVPVDHH